MLSPSQIIFVPVTDLKPYANNARTHSAEQISQLTKSIGEFGFTNPILVQDDLTVVAGHGRLLAAQKLNMKTVPVIKLAHLTAEQVQAYVIADNKLALNAGWDVEILKLELLQIQEAGDIDLDAIGFSDAELLSLLNDDQEVVDDDVESFYTEKVDTPIYTPKGERPELLELIDEQKTKELQEKISNAPIPEDVRAFLSLAAQRHNVFSYDKIAEYYCHATPEIKDLMEQSALVIIDFNKAIESGYVMLGDRLKSIYAKSYENQSDDEA